MESSQAKQANIFVQVDGIDNVVATWPGPKTPGAAQDLWCIMLNALELETMALYNDR